VPGLVRPGELFKIGPGTNAWLLYFMEQKINGFEIFSRCKSHLDDADIMIALLDGSLVDDGTAWEIGYFYVKKSPEQKIIGIRTDFRLA
jgi:nucleoside 2-deoxyribosyltransferase